MSLERIKVFGRDGFLWLGFILYVVEVKTKDRSEAVVDEKDGVVASDDGGQRGWFGC